MADVDSGAVSGRQPTSPRHSDPAGADAQSGAAVSGALAWTPAYIGLGSNLDEPPRQLRLALAAIGRLPATRLESVSAFYRNPPMGEIEQPDFVNAVAAVLTRLSPRDLLAQLKQIEADQGRKRQAGNRWGPRIIDLDLLAHGGQRVDDGILTLPHAGIAERNFVLFPLLEVAPGLHLPGLGAVVGLAATLDKRTLERID